MAILNTSNPVELSRALVLAYRPQAFFRRMCSTVTHRTKSFLIDVEKKTRSIPYLLFVFFPRDTATSTEHPLHGLFPSTPFRRG